MIERLNGELGRFLRSADGDQRLRAIGHVPSPSTPADLATLQKAESDRWGKIIRDAGIKAD